MTNFYDSLGINGVLNISANSNSNAVYISQLGNGNAVLIEDSANPDATPFIINSGGSVNIGRIEYLQTSGGTQPRLQVNNSTSQIPFSGLPFTTNFVVQGFNDNNIGFFTRDTNTSQIYFGSPSSVYGAKLSWYYTGGTFDLSTQTSGGTITLGTGQGLERLRITNDGNVGVGTQTPFYKLHISGDTVISSSLSASTITITSTPTQDQTATDYLVIDSITGLIKYKTTQPSYITTTEITTSTYTADTSYLYYGVTFSGNTDVEIPSPTGLDGFSFKIKDEKGNAGSYRIRVTPSSGLIDGNNYIDMNINYMSLTFVARNNNWWII